MKLSKKQSAYIVLKVIAGLLIVAAVLLLSLPASILVCVFICSLVGVNLGWGWLVAIVLWPFVIYIIGYFIAKLSRECASPRGFDVAVNRKSKEHRS